MTREEHLKLCEHCKNRNMQLSRDIFCNLYGDIPEFETQCDKYEFSEKVKKRSDKSAKRYARGQSRVSKGWGGGKPSNKWLSVIIPTCFALFGFVRFMTRGGIFSIFSLILGVGWLVIAVGTLTEKEEDEGQKS